MPGHRRARAGRRGVLRSAQRLHVGLLRSLPDLSRGRAGRSACARSRAARPTCVIRRRAIPSRPQPLRHAALPGGSAAAGAGGGQRAGPSRGGVVRPAGLLRKEPAMRPVKPEPLLSVRTSASITPCALVGRPILRRLGLGLPRGRGGELRHRARRDARPRRRIRFRQVDDRPGGDDAEPAERGTVPSRAPIWPVCRPARCGGCAGASR